MTIYIYRASGTFFILLVDWNLLFCAKEPFISFNSEAQGINVDGNKSTSIEQVNNQIYIELMLV